MAVVAAVAARRAAALREAAIIHDKNKRTIARNKERNQQQRAYLRELAQQQAGREAAARRQLSGYVAGSPQRSGELPSGEIILSTVVSGCAPANALAVHGLDKQRSHDLAQERALDDAFRTLDTDGSGRLERAKIVRVMSDLVPAMQPSEVEAGLGMVYDACGLEVGADVERPHMAVLLPALSDWAALARKSLAVAAARPRERSGLCVVS